MRQEYEVEITIPKDGDLDDTVLVRGRNPDNVDQATRKIFEIIQNPPKPFKPRDFGSGSGSSKQNGKGGQKGGGGAFRKPDGQNSKGPAKGGRGGGGGDKGKAKEKQ